MAASGTHAVAPAVAVAWLVLLLSGMWRSRATWSDRLGRGLGVVWLLLYVAEAGLWALDPP